jgi:CheY-like chemotaxis protein
MLDVLTSVTTPLLIVLVVGFLIYRFGFFLGRDIGGRVPFVTGGVILLVAALWEVVELVPDYSDWFVVGAYPLIDMAEYLAAAVGLVLLVAGLALYADYWQERREEVDERLARLSILDHLQHDSRQPYHFLELLNISLREILVHYPMTSGAVFLVNRARRQFVLTSSSGLRKEEVSYLEYYPLERNVVSQAVELGDPMLASQFDFIDRAGGRVTSRFQSVLILPLVSGVERIGGLLLFSEEEKFFTAQDIRYLSPVAQWLAEKIKATRLARQLVQAETSRQEHVDRGVDLTSRIASAARATVSPDALSAFCRTLVGLAEAESVHLCGLRQGELIFHGGSEPLFDLSENFRAALIEGMDRARPLIINQESTGSEPGPKVTQSNLIFPIASSPADALLLIRSERPFSVDEGNLKLLDAFAQMAGFVVKMEDQSRERLTRRRGFEAILELLQSDEVRTGSDSSLTYFIDRVCRVLGHKTIGLVLAARDGSTLYVSGVAGLSAGEHAESLAVEPGEGGAGVVAASSKPVFLYGRAAVARHFESYHDTNRSAFQRLFGERGYPEFIAYCPLAYGDRTAVAVIASDAMEESERGELERLLTLAAGLFSLRLAMSQVRKQSVETAPSIGLVDSAAAGINKLNNHLSALIGTAELASRDSRTHEEVRRQLRNIVSSAEQAAGIVREVLRPQSRVRQTANDVMNESIRGELEKVHVSGDLYMAGQRPREITLNLSSLSPVSFARERFGEFFRTLVDRFAVLAEEDDSITISTYDIDSYIYLDISRHRHNFPPVGQVAAFGRYLRVEEAFRDRPADVFLKHLLDSGTTYAIDREGRSPAFLSFRFQLAGSVSRPVSPPPAARLLAIDDQQVILDLISAMGQSLGYEVRTAASGEEGLRLAEQEAFDVVLTDLALPRLSGLEVARQISRFRPGVPIILVTGWATELRPEELAAAGITEVLYKPFRIDQLTSVVRAVVAGRLLS